MHAVTAVSSRGQNSIATVDGEAKAVDGRTKILCNFRRLGFTNCEYLICPYVFPSTRCERLYIPTRTRLPSGLSPYTHSSVSNGNSCVFDIGWMYLRLSFIPKVVTCCVTLYDSILSSEGTRRDENVLETTPQQGQRGTATLTEPRCPALQPKPPLEIERRSRSQMTSSSRRGDRQQDSRLGRTCQSLESERGNEGLAGAGDMNDVSSPSPIV